MKIILGCILIIPFSISMAISIWDLVYNKHTNSSTGYYIEETLGGFWFVAIRVLFFIGLMILTGAI